MGVETGKLILHLAVTFKTGRSTFAPAVSRSKPKLPIGAGRDISHAWVPLGLWLCATALNSTLAKAEVRQEHVAQTGKTVGAFSFLLTPSSGATASTAALTPNRLIISSCWFQMVQMASSHNLELKPSCLCMVIDNGESCEAISGDWRCVCCCGPAE